MVKLSLRNRPAAADSLSLGRLTTRHFPGLLSILPWSNCLILLIVTATAGALALSSQALAADMNRRLDEVLRRELPPNFSVSLQVADLRNGEIVMEKNPDLPLVPASTMKVVTSWAALSILKPDYVFPTEILVDGRKGSSVGNVFLQGFGDPYMVSEQLFALTREVRDMGLREVRGDIVADDSFFIPDKPLDEQEELGTRSYHAPYSALSLNFNSIRVVVHPGPRAGEPARVLCDPISEYAGVKARVETVAGKQPPQLTIRKETAQSGRETIHVTGQIGVKSPPKSRYVNVAVPSLYAAELFKEFLLREGIKVNGRVIRGKVPADAVSYLKFKSLPLSLIVHWLNKFSNNFMAEQVSLALGAAVYGAPGTREKGLAVIRKSMLDLGIDEGVFTLSEASGLSRGNRLGASALVRVLSAAANDFSIYGEFVSSLGVAGADGTLREKFLDNGARRRIRAKTGNLRGVNALAGYFTAGDGTPFVFAIIVNSTRDGAGFIDYGEKIVRAIIDMPLSRQ